MSSDRPDKLKPALIGGVTLGIISAIPLLGDCLKTCCCISAICGGFLAAYLYLKNARGLPEPPYGDGAVLGLATGAIGAVVATIGSIPFKLLQRALITPELIEPFVEAVRTVYEEQGINPDWVDSIVASLTLTLTGHFSLGSLLWGLVTSLLLFSLFAMFGSLIGVALLHKSQPAGGPPSGYMPPPPPASPSPFGDPSAQP